MRRALASVAALALAAAILIPAPGVAAKQLACDEGMTPGWLSMGSSQLRGPVPQGTHTFRIAFDLLNPDGTTYEDALDGTFEVSASAPLYPGTAWITPWGVFANSTPNERSWVPAIARGQPAKFALGWGNYQVDPITGDAQSRQQFTALMHGSEQDVSLDGGAAIPMHFEAVVAECMWLP